ncbi:MAG: bile acid:sodium symporter family protein [Bacteroidaceae bacterium]|nr:bile acid:sodium symporter family protein [Bacteroidaceae bacterium]
MKRICDFISGNMALIVLAAAVAALIFPAPLASVEMKTINPLLGVIMFGMGLTLKTDDFRTVLSRPKDILIGCVAQFLIMPGIAWLLAKALALPQEAALGIILVGCCPGGTASNVITYLAKGDIALSVGMTATSTMLAPLLTPLLVWLLAGTFVEIDITGIFLSIVYIVITPIVAGIIIQKRAPIFTRRVTAYLPAFSSLTIAFVVAIIVSHTSGKLLTSGVSILVAVVLHNLSGLILGYTAARLMGLPHSKRTAISIEVGMQNSGLASSLAATHFAAHPLAAVPGAIFSVWHNISGAIAAKYFSKKK